MLRKRMSVFASLLVALSAFLSACDQPDVVPTPPGQLLRAELPRITAPDLADDDLKAQVDANNQFAVELYHLLTADRGQDDLIFSPHSIENALAMTYAGARGDTALGMAEALNFNLEGDDLHAAFNLVDLALESRYADATNHERPFRLRNINQVFAQKDVTYEAAFLETLASHYDAGLSLYDFPSEHELARDEINAWVEDATEEKIKDLLAEGTLTEDTRLVLVNAIYFNAAWASKFEEDRTFDATFTLNGGDEVQVPTMHQSLETHFRSDEDVDAIALNYDGGDISMLVIAPKSDFHAFEAALTAETIDGIVDGMGHGEVELALPKFKIESERMDLKAPLIELGMVDAFDGDLADFSGMSEELVAEGNLYVAEVVHKAFIDVDESGTEAAAATAVVVGVETAMPNNPIINIDRPFIYAIRDNPTGQILFLGRVLDPR